MSKDFVRRFSLPTVKSNVKLQFDGQRTTCVVFDGLRDYFQDGSTRIKTNFIRDLRVADMVLGFPWLDDGQASLQLGTTRVFTLLKGNVVEVQTKDRRPECLLTAYGKV
jgi:hypothetical protein